MVMDDDDVRYFLHFLHEAFGELRDDMFRFLLLLAFSHTCLKMDESFEMKIRDLKNETSNEEAKINYSAERKMIRKIPRETIEQIQLIRGRLNDRKKIKLELWQISGNQKCSLGRIKVWSSA